MANMMVFTGNANPTLASMIAQRLNLNLGQITVDKFSDGETMVEITENVRGHDIFIVQSTCAPTNDNLMELITMADAFRRASAG
ncbi:MAG: ribose-phosphate pyrophosphokinase, partial [Legionellales bacterium]|nr:ribose-phosphate pyrophosphokinase [Legionellales bacterium]